MPSFSPDGKKMVFVSKRDGNREIYVMDLTRPVGRTQIAEALGVALGE
jgi:Tol biopolymer transport system component